MDVSEEYIQKLKTELSGTRSVAKRRDITLSLAERLINSRPLEAIHFAESSKRFAAQEMSKHPSSATQKRTNELAIARAQTVIFFCSKSSTQRDELVRSIEEAIDTFERYDDRTGAGKARQKLAYYHFASGALDLARKMYQQDLAHFISTQELSAIIAARNGLGNISRRESRHDEALAHFNDGLMHARALGADRFIISMLVGLGTVYEEIGDFRQAREWYEQALEKCDEDNMLLQCASVHMGLSGIENMSGRFAQSIQHSLVAVRCYEKANDHIGMCGGLEIASGCYITIGDYAKAMELLKQLSSLAENMSLVEKQAAAANLMATVYTKQRDFLRARELFQKSMLLFDSAQLRRGQCYSRANIAQSSFDVGDIDKAQRFVVEALTMSREFNFPDLEVEILPTYCQVVMHTGAAQQLSTEIHRGLSLCDRMQHKRGRALLLKCLGDLNVREADLPAAISLFHQCYELSKAIQEPELQAQAAESLATSYAVQQQFELAYTWQKMFHDTERKVIHLGAERTVRNMIILLETERLQKERDELHHHNELLLRDNEFKQKELSALALHLVQKNEMLETLKDRAMTVVQEYTHDAKALADDMVRHIEASIRDDASWDAFHQQFSLIHSTFVQTLSQRFSTLTPMELKVCALLRIQLSTKEIAAALVLSPRTVEDHRNRLRKKFRLTKDENLTTFLSALE